MAPIAVNEQYEHSERGTFVLIEEGLYQVNIFDVKTGQKDDGRRFYTITYRINGTAFDGEDVEEIYVGLQGKSLFKLYDILTALGNLDQHYNAAEKRWFAFPAPEELIGAPLLLQVEHEPYQQKKDNQLLFNQDGSPSVRYGVRPTLLYPANTSPVPEFKPTLKKELPSAPAAPQGGGGSSWSAPQQGQGAGGNWGAPQQPAAPAQQPAAPAWGGPTAPAAAQQPSAPQQAPAQPGLWNAQQAPQQTPGGGGGAW